MLRPFAFTSLMLVAACTCAQPAGAEQLWIGDPPGWNKQYIYPSPIPSPILRDDVQIQNDPLTVPPSSDVQTEEPKPIDEDHLDTSPEMKAKWDLWHRRVAEAVFVRFDSVAQRAFANSRPLAAQIKYTVTRDRQIINARLLKKTNNIVFNSMILMVLKSMNGNPLLEFPEGSNRQFMQKTATLSRNCGIGDFDMRPENQETRELLDAQLKKKNKKEKSKSRDSD